MSFKNEVTPKRYKYLIKKTQENIKLIAEIENNEVLDQLIVFKQLEGDY